MSRSLSKGEPLASTLRFLWPLTALLRDDSLEELIADLGVVVVRCSCGTSVENNAQILLDSNDDTSFFPGLPRRSCGRSGFVFLPSTLWQNPTLAGTRLDEEDFVLVGRERDDSSNQALTSAAVT